MNNLREKYEPLFRHILEKVNHDLLDLKTIFHLAWIIGCVEVVTYLLENNNHDQLDVKGAVNDVYRCVCDISCYDQDMNNLREKYEPLFRHILEKVNHDLLDLKTIFHLAWRIGCVEVVTYLLENNNHDQLDVKEAVNGVYRSVACRIRCLEVVAYLLENINHDQLDAKKAVNDLYRSVCDVRYYNHVMNNLRDTYDPLIRHILEKVNHDLLDLKTIFHLACRIRCLEVVAYLFENNNHDQVGVKEAVNDVFRSVGNNGYYTDGMNNLKEKYERLIIHILEKVNHDLLDLKTIFHLACRIGV
ncbi:unnamed protein product [Mytilus edulis]|uniref:Uncharacterized protein n=1 Tax=Mytilus edulis TaxID=6550 RepID=A0A8S3V4E3_MYTED|nr:unnamed protein product [Mytilus edulis]